MGYFHRLLKLTLLFSAFMGETSAYAYRADYFDIDGTLFHDSKRTLEDGTEDSNVKLPAFWAYWVLVRIDQVNNGFHIEKYAELDREGKLPYQILVNRHEIDQLRGLLATREGRAGDMNEFPLLEDPINEVANHPELFKAARPKSFVPGFYMEIPLITFMYHDDFKSGFNNFEQQLRSSVARFRTDPKKYEFRGPAYEQLNSSLARQSRNHRVIFMTDRVPENRDSIVSGLEFLHSEDLLTNPVAFIDGELFPPKLISTGGPYGRLNGSVFDFSDRKPTRIEQDSSLLMTGPLERHEMIAIDSADAIAGKKIMGHQIVVYENDPDYVGGHFNKMKELAAVYRNIKFALFHAGSIRQVLGSSFNPTMAKASASRWVIFTPNGSGWRLPTEAELIELEGPKTKSKLKSCVEATLSRKGGK